MSEVSFVVSCDAPLEVAFAYVSDYRHVPDYFAGITSYVPSGAQTTGVGASFDAEMSIGPTSMSSVVAAEEWEDNRRLVFSSTGGVRNITTYDFTAVDETHSRIDFRFEFRLPGGLAGRALAQALEPLVSPAAQRTAENLSRNIAEFAAKQAVPGN
ncbi:SRPBCC family protein [Nocardia aurantia]|uniref:Polyketide cyclase n=1 Tax=Nocardia aurantia TaxID=2585199 RepID=A0A7K0DM59_9NOCA|nr:SRPBCC family protein [Nocardia aurantia]MQY26402.1 hypothetical protein [Nocardia aurantia]